MIEGYKLFDRMGGCPRNPTRNMSELQPPSIDEGFDYSKLLAGHLGYLTESQEKSLDAFKEALQKANLYEPKSDDGGHPSHDDTTLLYVFSFPSLPWLC